MMLRHLRLNAHTQITKKGSGLIFRAFFICIFYNALAIVPAGTHIARSFAS